MFFIYILFICILYYPAKIWVRLQQPLPSCTWNDLGCLFTPQQNTFDDYVIKLKANFVFSLMDYPQKESCCFVSSFVFYSQSYNVHYGVNVLVNGYTWLSGLELAFGRKHVN